jgi:hypothetical protein
LNVTERIDESDELRRLALSMPDAVEHAHMNHPDFRVGKRIFATLGYPDGKSGMVKLNSEQQELLVSAKPEIFTPAKGAWGKHGSTLINLETIDEKTAASAIQMAWGNVAT